MQYEIIKGIHLPKLKTKKPYSTASYENPDESCPKCGGLQVQMDFKSVGERFFDAGSSVYQVAGQHLVLTCKRCSFAWARRCKDA